jgi:ubiquinone/menaquinone biosynthesis C-methylase UbiE
MKLMVLSGAGLPGKDHGMGQVYDDVRLARVYQPGNEMPEASLRTWTDLIGSFSPRSAPAVVEIGAGTGMFCAAMARWLRVSAVLGVDPSVPMLEQARRFSRHPSVHYVAGAAESMPARDGLFDLALLSRVIHHLPDRQACAVEMARILRPDGVVVIRTTFRENLDSLVYQYWPLLRHSDAQRFPPRQEVLADFTAAGFVVRHVTSFAQPVVASLRDYHTRMATRPQSKFIHLTNSEFQEGLQLLENDTAVEVPTQPTAVAERYDVAVLALRR